MADFTRMLSSCFYSGSLVVNVASVAGLWNSEWRACYVTVIGSKRVGCGLLDDVIYWGRIA